MSPRLFPWVVAALVGGMLLSWMLIVPQGAQPDEHSHLVRAGALVRMAEGDDALYRLPDRYMMPDPGCYAFDPFMSVACAEPLEPSGDDLVLLTRADDYPPGGHAVTGVATLLPVLEPVWSARLVAIAIATVFVTGAVVLALRRSRLLAAALMLAITPMAWASLPSANPSTYAIAGATALWVALLTLERHGPVAAPTAWLIAGSWSALVATRRDGLVWACIIVFVVAVIRRERLADLARRLGVAPLAVAGVATAVTLAWGVSSEATTSRLIGVAPLVLLAAEALRHWFDRLSRSGRWWSVAVLAVVAIAAWPVLVSIRADGWDTDLTLAIVEQTDDNLVEAIGRLGWLDAPLPAFAVFAWLVAVGGLVAYALVTDRRGAAAAAALAAVAAVTSWTFELLQNNPTGTYWQGRYSLPLVIGFPLLLISWAAADDTRAMHDHRRAGMALERPLSTWAAMTGLGIANVAAWAAARRWGVGLDGSYAPWRWDTALQPVPPIVALITLAACSVGLGWVILGRRDVAPVA